MSQTLSPAFELLSGSFISEYLRLVVLFTLAELYSSYTALLHLIDTALKGLYYFLARNMPNCLKCDIPQDTDDIFCEPAIFFTIHNELKRTIPRLTYLVPKTCGRSPLL